MECLYQLIFTINWTGGLKPHERSIILFINHTVKRLSPSSPALASGCSLWRTIPSLVASQLSYSRVAAYRQGEATAKALGAQRTGSSMAKNGVIGSRRDLHLSRPCSTPKVHRCEFCNALLISASKCRVSQ
jgi:hypothetical protein